MKDYELTDEQIQEIADCGCVDCYRRVIAAALESLKKHGMKVSAEGSFFVSRDKNSCKDACYSMQQKHLGQSGWLVFIPEGPCGS